MVAASLSEKGECLAKLGHFEDAVEAYKVGIKISEDLSDSRGVATKKLNLGTVYMMQGSHKKALKAYVETLKIFENLGEPATVAGIWNQIGMIHEETNQFDAADQAYRRALTITVQRNNPAGEADSLLQLGNLYFRMGRLEDAVIFSKQAADMYLKIKKITQEGVAHSNLANILIKLKRYDEARQEIHRAIECNKPYGHAAQPWQTWDTLCDLEQAVGNREAAERARDQAIQLYLAYRRDGGENHRPGGRLCHEFREALQENKTGKMASLLSELLNDSEIPTSIKALIPKLHALLAGSRDPGLAADPELHYTDAAEILFLLEELS